MELNPLIRGLPGAEIVSQGLADLQAGECTAPALLVSMAQHRLRRAGLLDSRQAPRSDPELRLYRLLRQEPGDAYARYNALRRELDSFLAGLSRRAVRR